MTMIWSPTTPRPKGQSRKSISNLMSLSYSFYLKVLISFILGIYPLAMYNNQFQEVEAEFQENDDIPELPDFPQFNIACINCNSLNMATVSKNIRMRKFYGIVSLKTDIIFLSDIRLCNKSGVSDFAFANKIFATNPYGSYTFMHNSRTNSRGVGILIKKSINFVCLGEERDDGDNYLLVKAAINGQTVIFGSIYGPNRNDPDFFVRLGNKLQEMGDFPIILGGDWNCTSSSLPLQDNPDIANMQALPNLAHSKQVEKLCRKLKITDPYRIVNPNLIDFSFAPWGNVRKNRSRIDFFLISKSICSFVENCRINPSVQSKLFDHKAVVLDFTKKKPVTSRPNISAKILRDPDLDIVVRLASYECYVINSVDDVNKNRLLNTIGTGFALCRSAGPDPLNLSYMHANLIDLTVRDPIVANLREIVRQLEDSGIEERELVVDIFLELLINHIRNEVINYQAFIFVEPVARFLSPARAPRGLHRALFMNSVSHGKDLD